MSALALTGGDPQYESARDVVTVEKLRVSGLAATVIEADSEAWRMLTEVLGRDPIGAWLMETMDHAIVPELDEDEKPTGKLLVAWTAGFQRDQDVPALPVVYEFNPDATPAS